MSKYFVEDTSLTAVADAIREKSGTDDSLAFPDGFVSAVEGIQAGGKAYSEYDDVCFWDYDGTLLYSCTLAEAQAMTELPEVPDHSQDEIPLTFEEWNWTLEEINALDRKADVGAMYSPTDGKTHFSIMLTPVTGVDVTLAWSQYVSADRIITIDWGDGTVEDYQQGATGQTSCSHTYTEYGTYKCAVDPNGAGWNPGGTAGLIPTPGNAVVVGTAVFDKKAGWEWPGSQGAQMLSTANIETCILPVSMTGPTGSYFFDNCQHLKHLNIPRTCTTTLYTRNAYKCRRMSLPSGLSNMTDYSFAYNYALEEIRLPSGLDIGTGRRFMFRNATALRQIELPEGTSGFLASCFNECRSLEHISIPAAVTFINDAAFSNTGILDYYFYPVSPPSLSSTGAFSGISPLAKFHILADSLEAYQTATNWAAYADYMVGDL